MGEFTRMRENKMDPAEKNMGNGANAACAGFLHACSSAQITQSVDFLGS